MIERLISELGEHLDLTAEELADIIWLTLIRQQGTIIDSTASKAETVTVFEQNLSAVSVASSSPPVSASTSNLQPTAEPVVGIAPRRSQTTPLTRLPIKVANPPSIRDPLALVRALRPLMQQVPSGQMEGLDEQATAQRIAEVGIWQPVVKPALEPWLELVLVADESASMLIWRQTVLEFRKLLRNYGAFRDVQLWGMYWESEQVYLRPGISDARRRANASLSEVLQSVPRQPEEILDPSGRRLIVLITDCVAAYWQSKALMKTLKLWSQRSPIAIAQVLPEWLWVRTAIRGFEPVQLTALESGMPNSQLVIDWSSVWSGKPDGKSGVCVPIVPLEPDSVLTWSQMVMGQNEAPGYWLRSEMTAANNPEPASLSPKRRVERFQVMSSPVAQRLISLVAASPVITLPVIRLIQETLLPKSQQMNVAEVLLGGLLEPINLQQGTDPDEVEYRFVDEAIRDLLLAETPVTDTVRVLSEFLERQFDKSLDEFVAELVVWSQSKDAALVNNTRPFATVTAAVLKRKGGKYREFVQQIELQYSRVLEPDSSGDTLAAHDYLTQRFAEIEDWIVEQFCEEELQFEMNLRPDEEVVEGIEQITLADTQEITANIVSPVKVVKADEFYALFELFAEIHFAVQISYFDHDAYISAIHEDKYPTTSNTFLNQRMVARVSVAVLLPNNDSSEFAIDSVDLTVPQLIRVYYEGAPNHQDTPTQTTFSTLQTNKFETGRITFETLPPQMLSSPFKFEVAKIEVVPLSAGENTVDLPEVIRINMGGREIIAPFPPLVFREDLYIEIPARQPLPEIALSKFDYGIPSKKIIQDKDLSRQIPVVEFVRDWEDWHRDSIELLWIEELHQWIAMERDTYLEASGELNWDYGSAKSLNDYCASKLLEAYNLTPETITLAQAKVTSHEVLVQLARRTLPSEDVTEVESNNLPPSVPIVIHRTQLQSWQLIEDLGNGVLLEMVQIPDGSFVMGSPEDEPKRSNSESPQHEVTLPSFFMGKYPVMQAQWQAVVALPKVAQDLDPDPSNFKGADHPVENVSWNDATEFCRRLAQKTGRPYRLPSEAEWEYACRARTTAPFHFGETITTNLANYRGTDLEVGEMTYSGSYGLGPKGLYREKTTPVGSFGVANTFGLYDMHGNVWEWCADHWHEDYKRAPPDGTAWLTEDENSPRLLRGGSWSLNPDACRSASRFNIELDYKYRNIGFRIVCSVLKTAFS